MQAMETKNMLSEEQTNKVTVWACTVPSFTLGTLADQVNRARAAVDDVQDVAAKLIRQWKARGKIKFVRGYWKWVKQA
jgi:uncharacterized protein YukE